jgi:chromosome segregation ATPase
MKRFQLDTTMFTRFCRVLSLAAAIFALGGFVSARPAHAADAPAATTFGSVDIQKLLSGDTKKAGFDQQISQLQQQLGSYLQQQHNYAMLNQADQTQLGTLLANPTPTAQDTVQINALEAKSTQAAQQLTALQQNQSPTQADKDQMTQLLQLQKDGQDALGAVQQDYQNQVQQKTDQLSQQLSVDVKAAITTVAKQHGLAVVFYSQVAI